MRPRSGPIILALGLGLTLLTAACATAPYTGRRQLLLVSEGREISMGLQTFQGLKRQYPLCGDPAINDLVFRAGSRIAAAANRPDYRWEFAVLINDKEANAFCLPGGKVGIFTGLLKYTRDEAGLATVIAHEAGHAIARHAGERQSQSMLTQVGGLGLGLGLGGVNPAAGQAVMQGYGLGTQLGILLPYSRSHELEADKIGLILMAKAGYDPALALDFWRRMMTDPKIRMQPPQLLSTHPAAENRLQAMAEFLPEAQKQFVPSAAPPPAPWAPAPNAPVCPAPSMPPAAPAPPSPQPAPAPPAEKAPEAAPAPKSAPKPDADFDDLELKPMGTRSQPAPSAPPCGQWVPQSK
jgi:predicted Zn-dependent protease